MKKLLLVSLVALSMGVCAQEKITDVASEAQMQKAISSEISSISKLENSNELMNYVQTKCDNVIAKAETANEAQMVNNDCMDKISVMNTLDVDTVKDQMIAELQELQSAGNYLFYTTKNISDKLEVTDFRYSEFPEAFYITLMPFAIIFDVIALPFTLTASLVTGF